MEPLRVVRPPPPPPPPPPPGVACASLCLLQLLIWFACRWALIACRWALFAYRRALFAYRQALFACMLIDGIQLLVDQPPAHSYLPHEHAGYCLMQQVSVLAFASMNTAQHALNNLKWASLALLCGKCSKCVRTAANAAPETVASLAKQALGPGPALLQLTSTSCLSASR